MSGRTAPQPQREETRDGVTVEAGATVWILRDGIGIGCFSTTAKSPGKAIRGLYTGYGRVNEAYSSRLAALEATRQRAARELARLDEEIAKERGEVKP